MTRKTADSYVGRSYLFVFLERRLGKNTTPKHKNRARVRPLIMITIDHNMKMHYMYLAWDGVGVF